MGLGHENDICYFYAPTITDEIQSLAGVRTVRLDLRGGDDRFVSSGLDRLVGGGVYARSIKRETCHDVYSFLVFV